MSRRDVKEIREKLLDEGVLLLMEQGYHGTGLQELVQKVGVPKGSFYNYFPSKEEFSAEVVRHYIDPFIRQLDAHLSRADVAADVALRNYFDELIVETERKDFKGGCLLGNLIGEIGDTSELCQTSLRTAVGRYREKLREGLARGQREGSFRTDIDAKDMADFLVNVWQGALLRMKIERSVRPLTQVCDMLLKGYFRA
ncbi:TetR family transcriptional regulator C-terminal domain-containing protein [Methylocystis echinoides]|uniref:TetR/AcrR family transcriptional regulator n=1 Tax=Methylocystis echinoides TaxID=29468 RepID=UPI0034292854